MTFPPFILAELENFTKMLLQKYPSMNSESYSPESPSAIFAKMECATPHKTPVANLFPTTPAPQSLAQVDVIANIPKHLIPKTSNRTAGCTPFSRLDQNGKRKAESSGVRLVQKNFKYKCQVALQQVEDE